MLFQARDKDNVCQGKRENIKELDQMKDFQVFSRASHQRQKLILNVFKHIRSRMCLQAHQKQEMVRLSNESSFAHPERSAEGRGYKTPCPGPPRPITGTIRPPKAHLQKSEDHRCPRASGNPNQVSPRNEGGTSPGYSQGCPQWTSTPVSRLEIHHKVSLGATLQTSFWSVRVTVWALGHIMGKAIWNYSYLMTSCLEDKPKEAKGRDFCDLECFVCPYLLGMNFQSHYWLDLGYGAVADSPLLSCQTQHDVFHPNKPDRSLWG